MFCAACVYLCCAVMQWTQLPLSQVIAAAEARGSNSRAAATASQGLLAAPLKALAPVTMQWADNKAAAFAAAARLS